MKSIKIGDVIHCNNDNELRLISEKLIEQGFDGVKPHYYPDICIRIGSRTKSYHDEIGYYTPNYKITEASEYIGLTYEIY